MDWSTRREAVRWYLRDHKWWWKWPIVVAIVAVWGAAFALFIAPWQPSPSSIDDTATPTTTIEETRGDDFVVDEVPIGRDITQLPESGLVPEPADDADVSAEPAEQESPQVTMTLEELAASMAADAESTEPAETDQSQNESTRVRRPTRSEPVEVEPAPAPALPAPIATPPPTTRPQPAPTTTVRPTIDTPLPTFSTRPPGTPTTTIRPVTPTTTTPPPTTPPPTTAAPPPTTTVTTVPPAPAPPPIVTAPAAPTLEPDG